MAASAGAAPVTSRMWEVQLERIRRPISCCTALPRLRITAWSFCQGTVYIQFLYPTYQDASASFCYRRGMKINYLGWGHTAAIGLAVGLGALWWPLVLVSFGACAALILSAMLRKRRSKAQ